MSDLENLINGLVAANRILAYEDLVDGLGHVSVRHPDNADRYLLSRSRSPGLVVAADILEFELDGKPVAGGDHPLYTERPIHGSIYEGRPDVQSVVHNHCEEILPFAITNQAMRPALHTARRLGENVPVWEIRDKFGDTDLLVTTMEQGRDMTMCLGEGRAVIMRGHGCTVAGASIPEAVQLAIALKKNAEAILKGLTLGAVTYLTPGEINFQNPARAEAQDSDRGYNRVWEYLCYRAGVTGT